MIIRKPLRTTLALLACILLGSSLLGGCAETEPGLPAPTATSVQIPPPEPPAVLVSPTPEAALASPTPKAAQTVAANPVPTSVDAAPTSADPVLVGAGDVGECGSRRPMQTADLLVGITGTVFTTGDNGYDNGTAADFQNCYEPAWGQFKARTRPVPGDHDYITASGAAYYAYFGENAGPAGQGYYSYDLGAWHIVALNSNVPVDGASPQVQWLQDDLTAHPAVCTLAYWHEPLFTSGEHRNEPRLHDLWTVLYQRRVDIVLNGHDHDYERFAPQTPDGDPDPARGIREFVVGTGGGWLRDFTKLRPNSEVRNSRTWGVLKLTLHPVGYDWEFIPIQMDGQTFRDSGNGACVP